MVNRFLGWRSDRCADFRADGKIKKHFCFIFKCLPTHRFRNFPWIENRTIIDRDTATFVFVCFLSLPTDWGFLVDEKKVPPAKFYFIFYFRPTDCTKKAREKSANLRINRLWPKLRLIIKMCLLVQSTLPKFLQLCIGKILHSEAPPHLCTMVNIVLRWCKI